MNNKQYKLINRKTNEETICNKVCIEGFDYYVSEDRINTGDYYISWETNYATEPKERYVLYNLVSKTNGTNPKKVIATNNPSFDIGQIIDELDYSIFRLILQKIVTNFVTIKDLGIHLLKRLGVYITILI